MPKFFLVNNFSVDYSGLYVNYANTTLFISFLIHSNFESAYKKPPFNKVAIFSDVILVSNHYGCKGETIKFIPYYLTDIIYKTVKPSHLKKLQIIQNINNIMY